jgi:Mg-chelatase subunit ChlD
LTAKLADDGGYLKVTINAEDVEDPPPQDIVAVIDISGSMDASCAGVTDGKT